jgi:hypothetical protein
MVTLSCPAPSSGGGVDEYVVEAVVGRDLSIGWRLPPSPPERSNSLTTAAPPGTYLVRMQGRNACGDGPATNEVVVVVP